VTPLVHATVYQGVWARFGHSRGRRWTADATTPRVTSRPFGTTAAEPSEGDFDRLPDLEKPVRGAARRGQTERETVTGVAVRAVKHDLGASELRADDER
jgi:hypothetical protein